MSRMCYVMYLPILTVCLHFTNINGWDTDGVYNMNITISRYSYDKMKWIVT